MSDLWLIDGYNLLYFLNHGASKKKSLSREALFAKLAEFASFEKKPVYAVFDGKGVDEELQVHRTRYFKLSYSQDLSADSFIERYLFENRGGPKIRVVTDDREISRIARGCGALVMGCQEFFEALGDTNKEREDILFNKKVDAHGFNRPFEDLLGDSNSQKKE